MAGRNRKPIELHVANGNVSHLTKKEIVERKNSEIRLGDKEMNCPDFVKNDDIAYEKWEELISLYEGIEFVSSSDIGLLARYCKTFSEYQELLKAYQRVSEIHYDCKELDESIEASYYDEEDEKDKVIFSYKVKKQLRDLFSINAILTIESAINKKMDMLIKMEDRLFLNPVAKIKNIPQKPKESDKPVSKYAKFGAGGNA